MQDGLYHVVLNANAGTANAVGVTADALQSLFDRYGLAANIDADTETPFKERAARALASPAQIIVAAGGDGTVTALAEALVGTSKTLAILPLGTVNALARDLGMPMKFEEAVASLAGAQARRIDVGEVNGRVFLHKVVVGFMPAVAAGREHLRGRADLAAKIGFLRYFFRRLARARRMAVSIDPSDGEARVERVQAIAVASNDYDEAFGHFFSRQRLDGGSLTLYVLKHLTFADLVRLTSGMFLGRWREDEALTIQSVRSVTINSHKTFLKVMLDGEVETLQTPLTFRIKPLALSVLTPATPEEAPREAALDAAKGGGP
jgi:diacylglycerol kinase family enzyme